MLFNSFTFAVFFVFVYTIYWLNKKNYKRQNLILLVSSYVFYGWWDARFLFLLIICSFVGFTGTLLIDQKNLSFKDKGKSYFFLFAAAFIFVFLQKIEINPQWPFISNSNGPSKTIFGWWILYGTIGFLVIFEFVQKLVKNYQEKNKEKFFLIWCVFINILILFVFKYLNFFNENFIALWSWLFGYKPSGLTLKIVLPVGLSFFIFQTISHTVDVYRKKIPASKSLIELFTYVAFFPQLVAGPIERGAHLIPQFQKARKVSYEERKEALWLITWGLYKKVVVADNLAKIVENIFLPYDSLINSSILDNGPLCLIGIYAFAIQIYCDFSGYTDIARGTARLLGFDILKNFNLPYFSINPSDFWRRWHISLSSWLRDYLYIPLGGNRNGVRATYRNIMITMLIGGIWHGAAWNFLFWGAYHGFLLIFFNLINQKEPGGSLSVANLFKGILMFHLVCLGWLLFRAENMATVILFLKAIFTNFKSSTYTFEEFRDLAFYSWFLIGFQTLQAFNRNLNLMKNSPWFLKINVWLFVITSLFSLGQSNSNEFIYFAF
jgi:D-alanyl-lipoteichoic acid acyltransferase DltB (MBOAT superfamily)